MKKAVLVTYGIVLAAFTVYSYALVDPNITLLNSTMWTSFREVMVQIGYHNRLLSWQLFLGIMLVLFGLHAFVMRHHRKFHALHIAMLAGGILTFAYPFLSHDLFNYMFDARILTHYGDNPYLQKALDYPEDSWLRFMHWTHRSYPYGPSFLPITLVPSFLSFGTLILNFLLFKSMFAGFYVGSVWILSKMNKQWSLFFATHPLVLLEGLVNAHNDLLGVFFALLGMLYLSQKKAQPLLGRAMLLISAGIKYATAPLFIVTSYKKKNTMNVLAALGVIGLTGYLTFSYEIQPWYYLNLFALIPFYFAFKHHTYILTAGLVATYYPYIALGSWAMEGNTELKHMIFWWAVAAQVGFSVAWWVKSKSLKS